jgi:hypothetical protein
MADVNDTNAANNVDDNNSTQNDTTKGNDTKQNTNTNTEPKADEKKYSDKEMNDISKKNEQKAVNKFMKDMGITDVEKAKAILKTAAEEEEKNKSVDEKTQEALKKAEKATLTAMNKTIENALLRKKVDDGKVSRATKLVDKENIIDENGEIDENKLNSEIEAIIKEFPELVPTTDAAKVGFKVGGDGKQDKPEDEVSKMRKIMGLK